jgi:putative FmdB family regulatory protein
LYEYACETCGVFSATRPMAEYDLPAYCPACAVACPRTLTLPQLAGMDGARRQAAAVNERSAHAPKSTRTHGSGCACCRPKPAGSQTNKSAGTRPWMISH